MIVCRRVRPWHSPPIWIAKRGIRHVPSRQSAKPTSHDPVLYEPAHNTQTLPIPTAGNYTSKGTGIGRQLRLPRNTIQTRIVRPAQSRNAHHDAYITTHIPATGQTETSQYRRRKDLDLQQSKQFDAAVPELAEKSDRERTKAFTRGKSAQERQESDVPQLLRTAIKRDLPGNQKPERSFLQIRKIRTNDPSTSPKSANETDGEKTKTSPVSNSKDQLTTYQTENKPFRISRRPITGPNAQKGENYFTSKSTPAKSSGQNRRQDTRNLRPAADWTDTFHEIFGKVSPENVLFVSGLRKNIVEADFQRTILPGEEHSPFARVIPLRILGTLQKTDEYLVIFHDKSSLDAWRGHVEHLFKLSNKYTMKSLMHPLVPPQRGFIIKGEKVDQLVKSFALVPAGSMVYSNLNTRKLESKRANIAQAGGYIGIVAANGERRAAVMLRIAGVRNLELTDVLQGIMYDGQMRNMAWDVLLETKGRISATHVWEQDDGVSNKPPIPSLDSSSESPIEDEMDLDSSKGSPIGQYVYASPTAIPGLSNVKSLEELVPSADAYKIHDGQRWVVYFRTERAAQMFARTWHCQPFPFPPLDDAQYAFSEEAKRILERDGGKSTKVFTEVLW